ncbi:MAG: tetratricopeptide repeat protein [Acidobacteria bacterium]|nr:MAG: tetratricopeptide repeat protein [Acidobacteriota bacterium]
MKVRSVMIALLVVLATKAAVLYQLGHHPLLEPVGELDGSYYRHLGEMVANGDIFLSSRDSFFGQSAPAFFLAPFYIYFLAFIFKLSHNSIMAVRAVQIVLGTAGVYLLALSVRRWFGDRAAWIAGALAGFCGLFTFFEILILPAALDTFFTALDLYLIGKAADEGGRRNWMLAGFALGLHALNRPHIAFVLAGLVVLVAVRVNWKSAAAALVAALVVIAPVTIRNYNVGGRFAFIATNAGINIAMGNGPDATGTVSASGDILPTMTGEWLGASEGTTAYLRQAASYAFHHPLGELKLLAKKSWFALSATFFSFNHSFPFFARELRGVLMFLVVGPALLLPLGIAGFFFARPKDRRGYGVWAAFLPLTLLSIVLVFVAARYRLPSLVMCAGLAGAMLSMAIDRWRAGQASALARPAAAAVLVAGAALWPTRMDDGRSEELVRMSIREVQSGNVAEAETWVQRALKSGAQPGLVHMRIGQTFEVNGRAQEAITHYKAALETNPKEPAIHFVLGRAYMRAGDLSAAVRELAGARVGAQQDAASRLLVIALAQAGRESETNTVIHDLDPARWNADQARQFAVAIANAGRIDLSIPAWERAAELSGSGEDYDRLGVAWAQLGRRDEALSALQEAVRRSPLVAGIHQNFALVLAGAGDFAAARAEADEALRLEPSNASLQQLVAALKGK